jgi:hypothetical protein
MKTAVFLALILSAYADVATAKPDFSQSSLTIEGAPREGDVVTFTVLLRNSGVHDAPASAVQIDLPLEAMFVDLDLEGATVDSLAKVVQAQVDLPAGAARSFRVRMVVPRDAGGRMLTPDLRVRNLFLGVEYYGGAQAEIDTKVRPGSGLDVAGIRIAPAGLAVLAVLALYPLLRVLLASRTRSQAPAVMLVIAIGFWTLFASMAARDWRSLSEWHETSCTIRDSRLRATTTSSSGVERVGTIRRARSTQTTTYAPLLALRYDVDGVETISTGFDTGSRATVGGLGGAYEEFSRWPIGETVPCWYDPAAPEDVVVIRGFGGAYFFALFPLPLAAVAIWQVSGRRR